MRIILPDAPRRPREVSHPKSPLPKWNGLASAVLILAADASNHFDRQYPMSVPAIPLSRN